MLKLSKNLPQFYNQNSKCLLNFPPEAAESLSPSLTSFTLVGEMMDSLPPSSVIFRVGDGSRMLSRAQPSADLLSSAAGNVIHSHWVGHLGMILGFSRSKHFLRRGAYLSMNWHLDKARTFTCLPVFSSAILTV